ncbi:Ankyrin repeat domain-containing protein [Tetrabaena socialis]|uniref:Ankyrin repeat domain-containing protein n=1 Tax=Tetrabaena socialis TaxID=47790 RepID=A0A2J8A841_9CHLO|nr:Ankyrin repeat domain-containing protein [Tetrabaena socialis]|eukprot:PNH08660.1 Ankyrin repeat domain-containing protein [Tetrabaena socialis]
MIDDPSTVLVGDTALMMACANGDTEVAKALLAASADVNARNSDGDTALFVACKEGHAEVATILLAAGADFNTAKSSVRVGQQAADKYIGL